MTTKKTATTRSTAKKVAPAKTPAKQTTKTTTTKTTTKSVPAPAAKETAKKSAPAAAKQESSFDDLVSLIVDSIRSGSVDYAIVQIDDALTDRIEEHAKKEAAAAKKKSASGSKEKKVPTPVKKKEQGPLSPEVNKTYLIDDSVKTHGGKKGKFLRFFKSDPSKSVMDIGEAKPIVVKTDTLRRSVGARRKK